MPSPPKTIDEYLARIPDDQRVALEKLRRDIRTIVPTAEECISYQVPTFRFEGRMLISFGAATKHCAIYPGAYPIAALGRDAARYDTSKGTLRFDAKNPLPVALVRRLVKARLAERAAASSKRTKVQKSQRRKPTP